MTLSEVVWLAPPAHVWTQPVCKLAESDRSLLVVAHSTQLAAPALPAHLKVVLKKFKGATKRPDLDLPSQRFNAERRYLWHLSLEAANVVRPYATVLDPPVMALVLPFFDLGSLDQLLHAHSRRTTVPPPWRLALALDVTSGVYAAHRAGIILRDVKTANVLVDNAGIGKIADLELAGTLEELRAPPPKPHGGPSSKVRQRFEGTPEYVAPELIAASHSLAAEGAMRRASSFASDVYALAITINEIATRVVPFSDLQAPARLHTVVETGYTPRTVCKEVCSAGARPRLVVDDDVLSPHIIERAWAQEPHLRGKARDLYDALVLRARDVFGVQQTWTDDLTLPVISAAVRAPHVCLTLSSSQPIDANPSRTPSSCCLTTTEVRRLDTMATGRPTKHVSSADEAAIGRREFMEDRVARLRWSSSCSAYIVADGHAGAVTAINAARVLPTLLARCLTEKRPLHSAIDTFQTDYTSNDDSGACIACAILLGRTLWTVHVGDCRIVVLCNNSAFSTRDHKPPTHGKQPKIGVARALGASPARFGISDAPEVAGPILLPDDATTIVIGSDGLFAHLDEKAVAHEVYSTAPQPDLAAKALVAAALDHPDFNGDNVAAIVVALDDPPKTPPRPSSSFTLRVL